MTIQDLRFKMYRLAAGVSQREIADAIGTTEVTVSRWETGRNVPALEIQEQVARLLGVRRWELWGSR